MTLDVTGAAAAADGTQAGAGQWQWVASYYAAAHTHTRTPRPIRFTDANADAGADANSPHPYSYDATGPLVDLHRMAPDGQAIPVARVDAWVVDAYDRLASRAMWLDSGSALPPRLYGHTYELQAVAHASSVARHVRQLLRQGQLVFRGIPGGQQGWTCPEGAAPLYGARDTPAEAVAHCANALAAYLYAVAGHHYWQAQTPEGLREATARWDTPQAVDADPAEYHPATPGYWADAADAWERYDDHLQQQHYTPAGWLWLSHYDKHPMPTPSWATGVALPDADPLPADADAAQ